jgi:hypothetical protein
MDEPKNKKDGRGGPRPGSGRPRTDSVRVHLSIKPQAYRLLMAHAMKLRLAPGAIVSAALMAYLSADSSRQGL